jgi:hypothetical protein
MNAENVTKQSSNLNVRMSIDEKRQLQFVMKKFRIKNMSQTIKWLIKEKLNEKK